MIASVMFNAKSVVDIEFDAWDEKAITAILEEQKAQNLIIDYTLRG